MKKISTLLLGLALTASASAQSLKVHTFPSVMQKAEVKTRPQVRKAPLNEDKELGKLFYGATQDDASNEPGIIKFYSSDFYNSEKLCIIYDGTDNEMERRTTLLGGTWYEDEDGEGAYYGYSVINYDMGYTFPQYFMKIDLETGEKTIVADLTSLKSSWQIVDDMKQNPVDNKLYAMRQAADGLYSEFGTVNPATGDFTTLVQAEYWYPSIAYDADGKLYGVRPTLKSNGFDDEGYETFDIVGSVFAQLELQDGQLVEVEKVSLKSWGENFCMWYTNSIYVDQETGKIYGSLMDQNSWGQYLYTIDKESGELTYAGSSHSTVRGLYSPSYKTDSREAAAKVSNVSSVAGENGQSITLTWTNPTLQVNGETLTELAEVRIFCGSPSGIAYATLPAEGKMGEEMSWTDVNPEPGVNTYFIVPCRKEGELGYPESWNAWGGPDAPGAPSYVNAERSGNGVLVTWPAPEAGLHGGWYSADGVTYTIKRYPDEKVLATGLTETSYFDNAFDAINYYSYTVYATNTVGDSEESSSYPILAGPAHDVPYTSVINSSEEAEAWTIIDGNNDGTYFSYSSWYAPFGLMLYTNKPGSSDDYAVSPAIKLEGGKTYKVQMTVNINYPYDEENLPDNLHDFEFVAGQGTTVEDLTNVFYKVDQYKNPYYGNIASNHFSAQFTPETSGDWNIALHWLTSNVYDWITLESFSISEVFANDLAVEEVEAPEFATVNTVAPFYVTVVNEGSNNAGTYTVEVVEVNGDGEEVVGVSAANGGLTPGRSERVYIGATFTKAGNSKVYTRIVFDADEETSNNVSDFTTVTVEKEGTVPFYAEFNTGLDLTDDTQAPISSLNPHSTFQSIYYPSELSSPVEGDVLTITRLGLDYSSNEGATFSDYNVKVYLNTTDKQFYTSTNWYTKTDVSEWVDFGTLCFDGLVSTVDGQHKILAFDLNKEYVYDMSKNLVVTIVKEGEIPVNTYPVIFHAYNNGDALSGTDLYGTNLRSLFYHKKTAFNFDSTNVFGKLWLPILHVAAKEYLVGIDEVTFGGEENALNGVVNVYNVSGQLVKCGEFNSIEQLGLQSGLYIVRDNNGNTKKIQVK